MFLGFTPHPGKEAKRPVNNVPLSAIPFIADGSEIGIEINISIEQDRLLARTVRHLHGDVNVILQADWRPGSDNHISYLIINRSGRSIRGVGAGYHFCGKLESLKNGQWITHLEGKCMEQDSGSIPEEPILVSGDWSFVTGATDRSADLPSGKYRYTVEYTTNLDRRCQQDVDIFVSAAEFNIP